MSLDDFRLDGRAALITGGSRGIGLGIAKAFISAGARVVITGRKKEGLDKAVRELAARGGEVTPMVSHAGDLKQIKDLAAAVVEKHKTIDILVNNAGSNPYFGPMIDAEEWAWEKTLAANLKGPFFLSQEAARVMAKQGRGRIIMISSRAGISPGPMMGIYSITKAGLIAMAKAMAKEMAPLGIRVNAIAPGLINTRFSNYLIETDEIREGALRNIPLNRYAEADEIAGAALFLASEASSFITGTVISVDGGATA